MAMTMKSFNPMANKARINAQLGMMTRLWMAFAKLPNKMSKSKKVYGNLKQFVCLPTFNHVYDTCIENTS